jgi:dipeptidyl aminopeptidase/acylaminoacyl peptidase
MNEAYADPAAFVGIPRLAGLSVAPDGSRVVASRSSLSTDGVWRSALWELAPADPEGWRPLTDLGAGGADVRALAGARLLWSSASRESGAVTRRLWRLDGSGQPELCGSWTGGQSSFAASRDGDVVLVVADAAHDARGGTLHETHPIRFWDADLAVDHARLLVGDTGQGEVDWRDLTPAPGRALVDAQVALTPNGRTAVSTWWVAEGPAGRRRVLVAVDTSTGARRLLADDLSSDWSEPVVSPDGTQVACVRETRGRPDEPVDRHLVVVALDGRSGPRRVARDWDRWPAELCWVADGRAVLVTADDRGRRPVFRVELDSGARRVLTAAGDHHWTHVQALADGRTAYAVRSSLGAVPAPVRLDVVTGDVTRSRRRPAGDAATAPHGRGGDDDRDGRDAAARLAHRPPTSPGPHPCSCGSTAGRCTRGTPGPGEATPGRRGAGYAVLLPDPAPSTGYGRAFVRRGWGAWGAAPYTDWWPCSTPRWAKRTSNPTRTAALGGSFGGYMVNWIAGQTAGSGRS